MRKKLRVGILFGGKSVEHEVSLLSAKNVVAALDRSKYTPVLLKIDRFGRFETSLDAFLKKVDVVFPILHGPMGEDGTVQGMLKLAGIPFVGSDVLGSAIGMDKDVMKRLLREAGLPVGPFRVFRSGERIPSYEEFARTLGKTLFVKPANAGSSVGISKARNARELKQAISFAFRFDTKVLVEKAIDGREIECALLGNRELLVATPGEIIPNHEFYSYEAKYLDENGASLRVPARLTDRQAGEVQRLAKQAFQTLEAAGFARVDFFLTPRGKWYVNEINTIPGFTSISMYPRMFAASGISYPILIDRLIGLALERFQDDRKLSTSRL